MNEQPKPDNPPAFPSGYMPDMDPAHGMTLLDYFAGQALIGLAMRKNAQPWLDESLAESAYNYANTMLAIRAKRTQS